MLGGLGASTIVCRELSLSLYPLIFTPSLCRPLTQIFTVLGESAVHLLPSCSYITLYVFRLPPHMCTFQRICRTTRISPVSACGSRHLQSYSLGTHIFIHPSPLFEDTLRQVFFARSQFVTSVIASSHCPTFSFLGCAPRTHISTDCPRSSP